MVKADKDDLMDGGDNRDGLPADSRYGFRMRDAGPTRKGSTPAHNEFDESKYDGEWLQIGGFLKRMTLDAAWTKEEANKV